MFRKKMKLLPLLMLGSTVLAFAQENGEEAKKTVMLNYEVKAGITPYERYGNKTYSERFDEGLDFGLEVYKRFDTRYALGFGGEVKRKLNEEFIQEDGERLYAYYILGKKNITDTVSLVARLGKTSQKEFDSKLYMAAGLEKRFGRVTVQLLGENTKLKNNFNNKNYTTVGLKLGYIFGDLPESLKVDAPVEPLPETISTAEPVAQETPVFKLTIEGDEITGGYQAYKTEIPMTQVENVKVMTQQLNEYDKSGTLEMTAYSDNTGTKAVNVKLAQERMDNLEKEFIANGLTEKVTIKKVDPAETVQKVYKVDNDTFDNRRKNRRIEVTFFEDEQKEPVQQVEIVSE